jgi:hypothetical protein
MAQCFMFQSHLAIWRSVSGLGGVNGVSFIRSQMSRAGLMQIRPQNRLLLIAALSGPDRQTIRDYGPENLKCSFRL